jgi:uncharacterized oxidoreductase
MKLTGNTVLITGGGSGIGLTLAEALVERDNEVIIAARSLHKLQAAQNRGLQIINADVSDAESVRSLASTVVEKYPSTNVLVHNAAICKREDLVAGGNAQVREQIVSTNVLGPMRLTEALLPHLLEQPAAAVLIVTSGLGFVPAALYPTYSATKAALHSYSQSLRFQLRNTSVRVIEIVPPYVQTELGGPAQATDPNAMPLQEFVDEALAILKSAPSAYEVLVKRVHPHRFAAERGQAAYEAFFQQYNAAAADRLASSRP